MFRVEHRALAADQTHGAVALHVFHCHLPGLRTQECIASLRVRVIMIICQNYFRLAEPADVTSAKAALYSDKAINKTCVKRGMKNTGGHPSS
jgi:hypothetical protein